MNRRVAALFGTLILLITIGLGVVAWRSGTGLVKPPPKHAAPKQIPAQKESFISVPVLASASTIEAAILRTAPKPLHKGTSDRISVTLFATEEITVERLFQELVKPATPGYWKDVKKKPWKLIFPLWIPPTEAIYKTVSRPVTEFLDRTFKVGAFVHDEITLEGIELSFRDQNISIVADVHIKIKIDVEQAVVPLGPKLKVKGLLDGTIKARAAFSATISVGEDARLIVDLDKKSGKFEFTELFVPGAVEGLDLVSLLNPTLLAQREILGLIIDRQLVTQIQKSIDQKREDLGFREKLDHLAHEQSRPVRLSPGVWLIANIKHLSISQPTGSGDALSITACLGCMPKLVLSELEPSVSESHRLAFSVSAPKPGISVTANLMSTYSALETKLTELLEKVVTDRYPNIGCRPGIVELYSSNDKVVVAVNLIRTEAGESIGKFYLWGTPSLSPDGRAVGLPDLEFTLESKKVLAQIATWVLEGPVQASLREHAQFNFGQHIDDLHMKIKVVKIDTGEAMVSGGFEAPVITHVFPDELGLAAYARIDGGLSISAK